MTISMWSTARPAVAQSVVLRVAAAAATAAQVAAAVATLPLVELAVQVERAEPVALVA